MAAGGFTAPNGRRFSPLTAPQRAAVDAFSRDARPWAGRQARRTYRHLPFELQEQAIDQAMAELRDGAAVTDRRALYHQLAESLDEHLRRVHIGWCLNQSQTLFDEADAPAREKSGPAGQPLTEFIEEGLGGLERAVLQLEIGAGRDTSVVRAALKLGPRQYARHREHGLSKLRGAITAQISGRVCTEHVDAVALAATGDVGASEALAHGRGRCRACAREAGMLRRVLTERLAIAPWPFAIKPAGILVAKLGGVGALLSGKSAGGASLLSGSASSSGAQAVATVLAATAVASGAVAVTSSDSDKTRAERTKAAVTRSVAAPATTTAAAKPATSSSPVERRSASRAERRGSAKTRTRNTARRDASSAAPATSAPATTQTAAPSSGTTTASEPSAKPVTDAVKKVTDTVDQVAKKVPSKVKVPVTGTEVQTPDVGQTVDDLTDTVDRLLQP